MPINALPEIKENRFDGSSSFPSEEPDSRRMSSKFRGGSTVKMSDGTAPSKPSFLIAQEIMQMEKEERDRASIMLIHKWEQEHSGVDSSQEDVEARIGEEIEL